MVGIFSRKVMLHIGWVLSILSCQYLYSKWINKIDKLFNYFINILLLKFIIMMNIIINKEIIFILSQNIKKKDLFENKSYLSRIKVVMSLTWLIYLMIASICFHAFKNRFYTKKRKWCSQSKWIKHNNKFMCYMLNLTDRKPLVLREWFKIWFWIGIFHSYLNEYQ